ncbi:MAG: V-type ATP synthase subunit E, partial [Halobacteria archaeon]|nr:V-type ATP synthase subunit E [Halobacteria archaeon]
MGLETVVEDIKEEARSRAQEIRQEAEDDHDRLIDEAEDEAETIRKEAEQEVENEIKSRREQTLSSAKLESQKMESRARKRLLDELRGDVEDRLAELDDGREELTRELLEGAIEDLDEDAGSVYSAGRDEELVSNIVQEYDGFDFAGTEDMLGGVIVEAEDGEVRIDNTFDSVLDVM